MEITGVTLIKSQNKLRKTTAKPTQLHATGMSKDHLGHGMEGYVTRVQVPIKERMVGNLAFKAYHSEKKAVDALKAWIHLKEAGVPIPSTFRLVEQDGKYAGILMTDLTNGWNNVLISSNETKQYVVQKVHEHNPDTVRALASINLIDEHVQNTMRAKIEEIAQKAATQKILFTGGDVLSAVFNQKGELDFVVSDMGSIKLESKLPIQDLFENNLRMLSIIRLMIEDAQMFARAALIPISAPKGDS